MATTDEIVEQLGKLSVLELVEVKKRLEDEWDVTAAAPVAVAAAAPAADGGGAEAAEKTEFDVVLEAIGDKKIQVIKAVRTITGLGLKEAKEMVDGAPTVIKEAVATEEAETFKSQIEEAGGTVELK